MCFGEYYWSEGCTRTGYFIPVRDGMEAGQVWKFFRRRRRRRRRRPPGSFCDEVTNIVYLENVTTIF